jgi:hypothetical protein
MRTLLALLFSLALVTPVSADCAWVLWATTHSQGTNLIHREARSTQA